VFESPERESVQEQVPHPRKQRVTHLARQTSPGPNRGLNHGRLSGPIVIGTIPGLVRLRGRTRKKSNALGPSG
jgi:hypothetical protein